MGVFILNAHILLSLCAAYISGHIISCTNLFIPAYFYEELFLTSKFITFYNFKLYNCGAHMCQDLDLTPYNDF